MSNATESDHDQLYAETGVDLGLPADGLVAFTLYIEAEDEDAATQEVASLLGTEPLPWVRQDMEATDRPKPEVSELLADYRAWRDQRDDIWVAEASGFEGSEYNSDDMGLSDDEGIALLERFVNVFFR